MNKLYFSALAAVLTAGTTMAQSTVRPVRTAGNEQRPHGSSTPTPGGNRAIVWQDDFSNAGNWTLAHEGAETLDWQIGVGLVNTGSFTTPPIESTTAPNGYAMLDSDGYGNAGTNYEQSFMTNATAIDLSLYPNVVLEFQNQYRQWTDEQCYIVISTNNTDWPTLDPATDISGMPNVRYVWEPGELVTSVSPGNPTITRFNISAVAGGQSTVWVRFYWSGIYGYSWFVDDVNISEQFAYDVSMLSGYVSHTGNGEEYGRIPQPQLGSTMHVGGEIANYGVNDQTNVVVTVDVVDELSAPAFNGVSAPISLLADSTYFVDEIVGIPALAPGIYTATITVSSDQTASDGDPANDVVIRNFEVTTDMYSLDGIDVHPAADLFLSSLGTNSFTDGADGLIVMNYYPLAQDMTVYGLEVLLANGTLVDGSMIPHLYDSTEVVPLEAIGAVLESGVEHFVGQGDLDDGRSIVTFSPPAVLPAGVYYAGVELFSSDNAAIIRILDDLTIGQPGMSAGIFIPGDVVYSNGNAHAIRMSANAAFGMADAYDLVGISVFPNPSTGIFNVSALLPENHMIEVMNTLGEIIRTERFTVNTTMDMSDLAKGVYTLRVSTAKASYVQRVTLN